MDNAIALSLSEFQDTNESEVNDCLSHDTRNVVSRLRMWETAKAYYKRKSFMSKTGLLKVTFATDLEEEDAVDFGGPRREFSHLLLGAICNDSSTLISK